MLPALLAQAAPVVDTSTPFTLAVVVLLLGVAAAFGAMQMQASTMKEQISELGKRMSEREKHGGDVDKQMATLATTLARVDTTVEKIANLLSGSSQRSA